MAALTFTGRAKTMITPHGHPKYQERTERNDSHPCVYCGKRCKADAPIVGVFYGREQPFMTEEDPNTPDSCDIYHPIGSGCLSLLKAQVPNLRLNPET